MMGRGPKGSHRWPPASRWNKKLTLLEDFSRFPAAFLTSCYSHSHLGRGAEPASHVKGEETEAESWGRERGVVQRHAFPRSMLEAVMVTEVSGGFPSSL